MPLCTNTYHLWSTMLLISTTQVQRRPAVEADLPFLLQLRAATMGPHRRAAGLDESLAKRQEKVTSHFASGEILEIDGRPIGLLKVLRQPEKWELLQLQLSPEYQSQAIGTSLVSDLVAQAAAANVPLSESKLGRLMARWVRQPGSKPATRP